MRKVLISILVCLLLIGTGFFVVKGLDVINVKGVLGLDEKNEEVEQTITNLSNLVSVTYTNTATSLKKAANTMQESKTEYETQAILSSSNSSYATELEPYEIDYLWTKLGNYAKDEGVIIKIDLVADGSSVTVTKTDGTETTRTLCTLEFTVVGTYSSITDFIYDIENDSKLGFRIDDFYMYEREEDGAILAEFSCTDIPVSVGEIEEDTSEEEDTDTKEEDTTEENTTNSTNNSTTNNTTKNTTSNTTNSTTNTTNTNS